MKRLPRQRAAALIVVLTVIVLITILVVGLTVATRLERSASFYDRERTRAEFFARQGIDYTRAQLQDATATNRYWVGAPGRITASVSNTFDSPSDIIILSSGFTNNTNADISADLNRRAFVGGDRLIDPTGTNFNFRWIYVQRDGSFTNSLSTNAVGRFAYWVDDDSTRVNLNTAAARVPGVSDALPSQISLGALPGMAPFASAIAVSASNAPFTTPFEVLGRDSAWTNVLSTNRFYLTHYSQDPDMNPWGSPRSVLTTQQARAQGRPYLNVLANPAADPGAYTNLSSTNLQSVYTNITSYLTRSDWPYARGNSFVTKFGASGVSQLALDILEYVRSTESFSVWPEPIFAQATTNSLTLLPSSTTLNDAGLTTAVVGTVRRPMISQVGVYCSTNTDVSGYLGTLHVQMYLPTGYNAGATNFSGWSLWAQITSSGGGGISTSTNSLGTVTFLGGYANCAVTNVTIPASLPGAIPTNSMVRVALLKAPSDAITNILDVAPLNPNDRISCATATNVTAYASVNDPRLNKTLGNWSTATNLAGDVAPPAHAPNFSAFVGTPSSDGGTNSVFFSGTASAVGSVGELGLVASGIGSTPAAPWRSLRFRMNSSSATNIPPDWAVMDLFSAPVPSRFLPGSNVTTGRINLNAFISDGANFARTNVLNTLFTNATTGSLSSVVSNVINVRLSASGNYGNATNFTNIVSVGQLAEVVGIGDQGEVGETGIRKVASLVSVRGDAFTVFSTGQAIQVVNNKVTVNGEKMIRATVERYFEGGEVKFRIISWSEIYP